MCASVSNSFSNCVLTETAGIISGCQMKCDEKPCKNKGVCIEDFLKFESTCDCELTSYYGEFCGQGKPTLFPLQIKTCVRAIKAYSK